MHSYPMSPSEKAAATRQRKVTYAIRDALAALPPTASDADVVAVFASATASKAQKADAFWMLDERPGLFHGYLNWHPILRRCRNHPVHGRELFKTWS